MPSAQRKLPSSDLAFKALHMVFHERDFRVRVNDPTINFVRRMLGECVKDLPKDEKVTWGCPACQAGFDFMDEQPTTEDRK